MNKLTLAFVVSVSALSIACSGGDLTDGSTDEGALEQSGNSGGSNDHLAAVTKCTAAHTASSQKAVSTADMVDGESTFTSCVTKANDAAVAKIEANLKDAGSELAGTTKTVYVAYRKSAEALCVEGDKASFDFGGTASGIDGVACRSQRELLLAMLIDSYAAMGDQTATIPEDRTNHANCYAKYDAIMNRDAVSNADMAQAGYDLAACVTADVQAMTSAVAEQEVANDASAGPAAAASARLNGVIQDAVSVGGQLCGVLNEAGTSGAGSLSKVTTGPCQTRVAESVFATVHGLIGGEPPMP